MKKISLVIPCYNEEKTVFDFFKQITPLIEKLNQYKFEFVFVDDGSSDDTVANLISLKNSAGDSQIFLRVCSSQLISRNGSDWLER